MFEFRAVVLTIATTTPFLYFLFQYNDVYLILIKLGISSFCIKFSMRMPASSEVCLNLQNVCNHKRLLASLPQPDISVTCKLAYLLNKLAAVFPHGASLPLQACQRAWTQACCKLAGSLQGSKYLNQGKLATSLPSCQLVQACRKHVGYTYT